MMKTIVDKINLKNLLIIPIIFLILFQVLIFSQDIVDNYFNLNFKCPLQISESVGIDEFSEKKLSYINEEVSIFPKYKNLLCLGKFKLVSSDNQQSNIYFYSSNNFYEILNFVGSAIIFIFFIGKDKKYIFLFFLSVFNIFNALLFYKPNFYSSHFIKYFFIYFINIFLFNLFNKNLKKLNTFDYSTILLVLLLFFNYQIFSNFLLFYFCIFYITNDLKKGSNIERYKEMMIQIPIIFYLLRMILSLNSLFINYWRTLSQNVIKSYKIFGDLQLTLNAVNCNSINSYETTQQFKFANQVHSCPFETGYPLIDQISFIFFDNIWISTLFISGTMLLILSYFYKKIIFKMGNFSFLFFLIFISPPFNFLIERMNVDLAILIFMLYLGNNLKNRPIINSLVIIFSTFLKLFTFPLAYSYMLISIKTKDKFRTVVYGVTSLLVTIFLYLYIFNTGTVNSTNSSQSFYSSILSNPSISFGVLSSSSYFSNMSKFSVTSLYLASIFFIILLSVTINYFYSDRIKTLISNKKNIHDIVFIPIILLILLYENIDYRLTFLILIFSLICNLKIKLIEFLYFFLVFSSATNYLLLNNMLDFLNIISQYFLFAVLVLIFYTSFKINSAKPD